MVELVDAPDDLVGARVVGVDFVTDVLASEQVDLVKGRIEMSGDNLIALRVNTELELLAETIVLVELADLVVDGGVNTVFPNRILWKPKIPHLNYIGWYLDIQVVPGNECVLIFQEAEVGNGVQVASDVVVGGIGSKYNRGLWVV